MNIDHDMHVHSSLSACCRQSECTVDALVDQAVKLQLSCLGITDHVWDAAMPGASAWYTPQNMDHVRQGHHSESRQRAAAKGLCLRFGAETEFLGGNRVGISVAAAESLDYVLIPFTHLHMENYVRPAAVNTPERLAVFLIQRFEELLALPVMDSAAVVGIPHPFVLIGMRRYTDETIRRISDATFIELFARAAEKKLSIEVHVGAFASLYTTEDYGDGMHDETAIRVYTLAKQAGCRFHFASDAHSLDQMAVIERLAPLTKQIGLQEDNLHDIVR